MEHTEPDIIETDALLDNISGRKNSFIEVTDKTNRRYLQQYMKYCLGITHLAIGVIRSELNSVRNFMVWLKAPTLLYLEMFMNFLEADESKEETEKDIWNLDCLEIDLKQDITRPCRTISFTEINQLDLREELKKAVYFQLKTESMGVLQQQAGMVDPKRYIGDMVLKSR